MLFQSAPGQTPPTTSSAVLLKQADELGTKDHPKFVRTLEQLHRQASTLSSSERWHLRYLDAWEALFVGHSANAEANLVDVIDHSGDTDLAARASALLLSNLGINRRYEEAFVLANRLVADLPTIKNPRVRFSVLGNLAQTMMLAGQNELAVSYTDLMEDAIPPGQNRCIPLALRVSALFNDKRLKSSSPMSQQALDTCLATGQAVLANTVWLDESGIYLDEDQPAKAIAVLDQIAPRIQHSSYHPHLLAAQVQRARAYAKLGADAKAVKAALAAIAMSDPDDINEWLLDAYKVLYGIEKKRGNTAMALSYYERYVAQEKGNLSDTSARAVAYQMVQQKVLAKRLETEELSKQNSILKLQQALDAKAAETSRLYITLLIISLAAIALWLFRTMRSQMRFKGMATRDGLTGTLNHQHFMSESERLLRNLEKKGIHAGMVSIDLDHFKQINDTYGHAMGDAVLQHTVEVCRHHLRQGDLFGRLGGEEFGILLPDCSWKQAVDTAERIRLAIVSRPLERDSRTITTSASVGVASTIRTGHDLQQLCRDADAALYRAKHAGRNRVMTDLESHGVASV